MPPPHPPITLIAYGSLMSGFGLLGLRSLPAVDAARVRLENGRRGFGKLSQYGDRYAMVLEPLRPGEPLQADILTGAPGEAGGRPQGLALTITLDDLARVSLREGYRAQAIASLAEQAVAAGTTLPRYLWSLLEEVDFDPAGYRRGLFARLDYTSAHYVPHPVSLAGAEPALTFLAPGAEGSGSDAVVPVRVQTGMTRLLSLGEASRLKPNASQLDYFTMCLLAEEHNLSLADVVDEMGEDLRARVAQERAAERGRFLSVLGLDERRYAARFSVSPCSRRL